MQPTVRAPAEAEPWVTVTRGSPLVVRFKQLCPLLVTLHVSSP